MCAVGLTALAGSGLACECNSVTPSKKENAVRHPTAFSPQLSSRLAVVAGLTLMVGVVACGGGRTARAQPVVTPDQTTTADALCERGRELFVGTQYAEAAEQFDRCAAADPMRAYAYYRAGLAYYEIGRTAVMVDRFERFVKLAPDAPERAQVESILNTVRGR